MSLFLMKNSRNNAKLFGLYWHQIEFLGLVTVYGTFLWTVYDSEGFVKTNTKFREKLFTMAPCAPIVRPIHSQCLLYLFKGIARVPTGPYPCSIQSCHDFSVQLKGLLEVVLRIGHYVVAARAMFAVLILPQLLISRAVWGQ